MKPKEVQAGAHIFRMESLRNQLIIWGHLCYQQEKCHTPDRVLPGTQELTSSTAVDRLHQDDTVASH